MVPQPLKTTFPTFLVLRNRILSELLRQQTSVLIATINHKQDNLFIIPTKEAQPQRPDIPCLLLDLIVSLLPCLIAQIIKRHRSVLTTTKALHLMLHLKPIDLF